MANDAGTQHGPDYPIQKPNGKWTFYFYPNGIRKEIGEFNDEASAVSKWVAVKRIWESNGSRYDGQINCSIG